eukprot:6491443-Amphidinium_carterae.1
MMSDVRNNERPPRARLSEMLRLLLRLGVGEEPHRKKSPYVTLRPGTPSVCVCLALKTIAPGVEAKCFGTGSGQIRDSFVTHKSQKFSIASGVAEKCFVTNSGQLRDRFVTNNSHKFSIAPGFAAKCFGTVSGQIRDSFVTHVSEALRKKRMVEHKYVCRLYRLSLSHSTIKERSHEAAVRDGKVCKVEPCGRLQHQPLHVASSFPVKNSEVAPGRAIAIPSTSSNRASLATCAKGGAGPH